MCSLFARIEGGWRWPDRDLASDAIQGKNTMRWAGAKWTLVSSLRQGLDGLLRGVIQVLRGDDIHIRLAQDALALLDVGALQADDQRDLDANLMKG